jgi:hypothetical protein
MKSILHLTLGTKYREPRTEPKLPRTESKITKTEKFGSYLVPISQVYLGKLKYQTCDELSNSQCQLVKQAQCS